MEIVTEICQTFGTANNIIVAVPGKKRTGKTTFLTLIGYMCYLAGIPVASNYKLGYPYTFIRNSTDFKRLRNCICLLDDFNKWASSKMIKHKKSEIFGSIINDSGKNNVSIIYSTKYMMQILKSIRHETDYIVFIELSRDKHKVPYYLRYDMFDFSMDMPGSRIETKGYMTAPIFNMFNTSEVIKQL